jgi:hypothetical protein
MPRYIEVVHATHETATKIFTLRRLKIGAVQVTTNGGKTASVSWDRNTRDITLNMPTLPPESVLTRAEADRLVAFIVHECCHPLHTDQHAWQHACRLGDRVRTWTNCLEDVRIEAKEIKAGYFPAMRTLLSTMCNHLHVEARTTAARNNITIGARVADAPFVASVLGRLANGYTIPAAGTLRADMVPAVATLVNHALAGVKRCKDTDAVLRLARELVQMEKDQQAQQPQPTPPPQPQQDGQGASQDGQDGQDGQGASQDSQDGQDGQGASQDGQDGQDGQGASQDGQDGQGASQDSQDGQGASQDSQDGQGASQDGQDGSQAGGGHNPGDGPPVSNGDADISDTINKIADRAGIDDVDHYQRTSDTHKLITARSTVQQPPVTAGDPYNRHWGATLGQKLARNSVLHGQIGRLLVSEEVHRRTHHETTGRLDKRALVRMRAGAVDVFTKRDDTPGMDTALMLLIDGSSSMEQTHGQNSRTTLAQVAAWHIARAAEAANAKVAIAAFHTPRGVRGGGSSREKTGAEITVVKPWSTPIADCVTAMVNHTRAHGWTPLSPAIIACAGMLAEVNATRHILMVLTDGECDYGASGVRAACTLAEDHDVEVVGVGMACPSVTAAFPPRYSVNVSDLSQLAGAGLGVLVQMLEDANPRAGGND